MNNRKLQFYFLLTILAGTLILTFFIFRPFLYALVLAVVFATVFQPIYQKIVGITRGWHDLSAFATVAVVVVLIFTPFIFLGIQIFQEAQQLYFFFADGDTKDVMLDIFNSLMNNVQKYFPATQKFSFNINQYLGQGLHWLLGHLG